MFLKNIFSHISFFLAIWSDIRVPNHGIHTGYIVGGSVVSLANLTWGGKPSPPDRLFPKLTGYQTGKFRPRNGERDISTMVLQEDSEPWPGPASRVWKIGDSALWTYHPDGLGPFPFVGDSRVIPLKDIDLWDASNKKSLDTLIKTGRLNNNMMLNWRNGLIRQWPPERENRDLVAYPMEWDFLPIAYPRYVNFYNHNLPTGNRLEVWEHTFSAPVRLDFAFPKPVLPLGPLSNVRCPFFEPFLSYQDPGRRDFFFLTKSGALHRLPQPNSEDLPPRATSVVWDRPEARITIVLSDSETNRVYMAGPDTSDPKQVKWFWFELQRKPVRQEYTPGPMPKCRESLRSTLQFARFLLEGKYL